MKYGIIYVLFVSSRPREGRTMREGYQIYRTKDPVNVLIPCSLIERLLSGGVNLNITTGAFLEPSLSPRPVSRPSSVWSTVEEVDSPTFYQVVLVGRFESRLVDQDMPPLKTDLDPLYDLSEPQYEPEQEEEIFLLTILPVIEQWQGMRHSASCSHSSQRERTVKEAIYGQRETNRKLKEKTEIWI